LTDLWILGTFLLLQTNSENELFFSAYLVRWKETFYQQFQIRWLLKKWERLKSAASTSFWEAETEWCPLIHLSFGPEPSPVPFDDQLDNGYLFNRLF
jgi:hypothetical protein